MAQRLSAAIREAMMDAALALLNGGTINIYDGAQPSFPGDGPAGTLLAQGTLASPAFAASVAGGGNTVTSTLNAVADSTIAVTGTAVYCRLADSVGNGIVDGNIGTIGSGALLEVASTSFVSGDIFRVVSLIMTYNFGS